MVLNRTVRPLPSAADAATAVSIALYAELLKVHDRSSQSGCPVLTDAGVCYVRQALAAIRSHAEREPAATPFTILPHWDPERRQLWLGDHLVKDFRQPASNQVAIVTAFHDRGWAIRRIDNPLPTEPRETAKERHHHLQDTLKNLNRGLAKGTIHFHIAADGKGVRWDYCADESSNGTAPAPHLVLMKKR